LNKTRGGITSQHVIGQRWYNQRNQLADENKELKKKIKELEAEIRRLKEELRTTNYELSFRMSAFRQLDG
jgi:peptidoglycan hydrolase CwlO-like protein